MLRSETFQITLVQYHSGDRTAILNRIYLLQVSYGCIKYISVVLTVSCVLLVAVSLQRSYFFFRVYFRNRNLYGGSEFGGKLFKYSGNSTSQISSLRSSTFWLISFTSTFRAESIVHLDAALYLFSLIKWPYVSITISALVVAIRSSNCMLSVESLSTFPVI